MTIIKQSTPTSSQHNEAYGPSYVCMRGNQVYLCDSKRRPIRRSSSITRRQQQQQQGRMYSNATHTVHLSSLLRLQCLHACSRLSRMLSSLKFFHIPLECFFLLFQIVLLFRILKFDRFKPLLKLYREKGKRNASNRRGYKEQTD